MLGDLLREAELARRSLAGPPREEHARRLLTEHIEEFRRHLAAKEDEADHVADTVSRVKKILDGCGFKVVRDIAPEPVQDFLASLLGRVPALPPFDPAKESYTKRELAALRGVTSSAIPLLVHRHRLQAEGKGRERRFPRRWPRPSGSGPPFQSVRGPSTPTSSP